MLKFANRDARRRVATRCDARTAGGTQFARCKLVLIADSCAQVPQFKLPKHKFVRVRARFVPDSLVVVRVRSPVVRDVPQLEIEPWDLLKEVLKRMEGKK